MSAARCPLCRKAAAPDYRPFCSRRCADVDLARWLRGDYVVPGRDGEAADRLDPGDGGNRTE
jgi:uncharacterized protein